MHKPIRGLLYLATKALIIILAWRVKLMGRKLGVGDVMFANYKNFNVLIGYVPEKGEQPENVTKDILTAHSKTDYIQ